MPFSGTLVGSCFAPLNAARTAQRAIPTRRRKPLWPLFSFMASCFSMAMIRLQTIFVILVVLNLVGLTIAAFIILRRK